MNKCRNNSIDVFRYVCAIMVVAIHTCPFEDISRELGYVFSQVVPRIAVPFFFCVAGYYYIGGLLSGKNNFLPYVKKLLFVYTSWSMLYYVITFFQNVVFNKGSLFDFVKGSIKSFFISGSYYHFWYFPAIFFAVL